MIKHKNVVFIEKNLWNSFSPFLFNICVEIMGIMIRQNRNSCIRDIHIQKEYSLFKYADDTIMFKDGTEKNLKAASSLLFQFSNYSGLNFTLENQRQFG